MKTKHLQRSLLITVIILLNTIIANAQPLCYNAANSYQVDVNPVSLCYADFNNDGKTDLATANLSGSVSVLLGNGTGGFGTATNIAVGYLSRSICTADFNNDGNADIATTNTGPGTVSILLGNGAGGFAAGGDFSTAIFNSASRICSSDFNNDGKPDLVITSGANFIKIILGDGAGNFSIPVQVTVSNNTHAIISNDFNGDGKADLAISTFSISSNISILLGNGTGGFGSVSNFPVDDSPEVITSGYFNSDTIVDIATANKVNNSTGDVSILLGNGTGGFATVVNYGVGTTAVPVSVCTADFNGDGKNDLATANTLTNNSSNVSILIGNGSGVFGLAMNFAVDSFPSSIIISDFNNDGKMDLALATSKTNIDTGKVSILLNCVVTGINQFTENSNQVILYPNPTSEFLKIETLQNEKLQIETYSVIGEKVLSQKINSNETLSFKTLPAGMYYVKIISEDKNFTTKKIQIIK